MESVNSATKQQALAEAMIQLGNCMKQLVATLADNYDPQQPFCFAKLDIEDSFWRMAVSNADTWNFCYVLAQLDQSSNIKDTLLVVPNCLQMGWCESPPFFCAASETARDVIEALLQESSLLKHHMEEQILQELDKTVIHRLEIVASYINLIKVFVDDFIVATNDPRMEHLEHFS